MTDWLKELNEFASTDQGAEKRLSTLVTEIIEQSRAQLKQQGIEAVISCYPAPSGLKFGSSIILNGSIYVGVCFSFTRCRCCTADHQLMKGRDFVIEVLCQKTAESFAEISRAFQH